MVRCYSLEYQDVIPLYDSIHCRKCRNQVARVHDYIRMVWPQGIFARLFNVLVPESENSHLGQFETTVINANCIGCGELIGWKIIAVTRQNMDKLSLWNDVPLLHLNGLQDLGVNEENADQHGDPNEQNVDQDGDATHQDGDTNEQNVDQDGNTNEHAPNEQGGANKQNADQDKDTNEEDVGTIQYNFTDLLMHFICQNANQGGGGGNEQYHDQDGGGHDQVHNEQDVGTNEKSGANKQNADQDKDTNEEDVGTIQYNFTDLLMHFICQNANQGGGGGNEQNHDQDGGGNEQVNKEQDVGANEKSADQDGDSTDQDGDTTDQDAETTDRDGDATDRDGDATD
ncbi:hypothetical protein EJD97_022750 [Solanum chilense]|uniref:Yippee domain-containing protein n=1 Tax=Solanum chilense TaxID=4083 RepID=A0A6N2AT44_SOLCI|nr:hypothetical protein EJD97_022750 [Solanum chilense]